MLLNMVSGAIYCAMTYTNRTLMMHIKPKETFKETFKDAASYSSQMSQFRKWV